MSTVDRSKHEQSIHHAEHEKVSTPATGFVRGNPLWNQLVERAIDADAFQRRVEKRLARDFGASPCRSALSAHVVTALA